ncbi:MAG TPA: hypothetical protein VFR24_21765 [Candidatus Angelobacter sp.]|jgi:hypothetical protein|nr:hypothetical protein [Candidatus Angelobacter sp.]
MIFKAAEDFKRRTLGALPTLVEKVAYICSLQTGSGGYVHWGFTRAFGNRPTQEAIYAAHMETSLELVHVPVREIYKEYLEGMARSGSSEFLNPNSFVLKAPVNGDALLSAHLHLLQESVVALARQGQEQEQGEPHQVA